MGNDFQRTCIRSYINHKEIDRICRDLAGKKDLQKNADIFSMLGDLTRLRIIYCLSISEELCVCDLSDILGMGVSAISHQLRKLKDRNVVKNRRDGLTIYYSLSEGKELKRACELLGSFISSTDLSFT